MRTSIALLFLVGCSGDVCIRNSDCPPAQTCSATGVCGVAPPEVPGDAGADALEAADGGVVDSTIDGGSDVRQQ